MNKSEFLAAVHLAESRIDLSGHDDFPLHGCALPEFEPVFCSIEATARFLRWQAMMLNGHWDYKALTEMQAIFRRKVMLSNPPQFRGRNRRQELQVTSTGPRRAITRRVAI